jgi:Fe-coproporphyrin III synthase
MTNRFCPEKDAGAAVVADLKTLVRFIEVYCAGHHRGAGLAVCFVSHTGEVFPCDYLPVSSGNVNERKFSDIWQDTRDPIMAEFKDRLPLLKGRCANCRFKNACGGGLRARAESMTGDP